MKPALQAQLETPVRQVPPAMRALREQLERTVVLEPQVMQVQPEAPVHKENQAETVQMDKMEHPVATERQAPPVKTVLLERQVELAQLVKQEQLVKPEQQVPPVRKVRKVDPAATLRAARRVLTRTIVTRCVIRAATLTRVQSCLSRTLKNSKLARRENTLASTGWTLRWWHTRTSVSIQ